MRVCRDYYVTWNDMDGKPIEGAEGFDFPSAEEAERLPTCTCWIGDGSPDGEAVFQAFVEHLRPMLREPFVGKIVIEVG